MNVRLLLAVVLFAGACAPVPPHQLLPNPRDPLCKLFPPEVLLRHSGTLVIWAHVRADGVVTQVEVKKSVAREVDEEAVAKVQRFKYNPEPKGFIGEYVCRFGRP